MKCPICNSKAKVIDCRPVPHVNWKWRERECTECGFRFATTEKYLKPIGGWEEFYESRNKEKK